MPTLWEQLQQRQKLTLQKEVSSTEHADSESLSKFDWSRDLPVPESPELHRILSLPRRPMDAEKLAGDVRSLTERLRRPGGTREFRVLQAAALREAEATGGLVAAFGVGEGKTDISVCLPTVLNSKTAVLLVPASLKSKLLDLEYPHLETQWRIPNLAGGKTYHADTDCILHVISYSQLSTKGGMSLLEDLNPDLIICDEAQALKDPNSTRTKRFRRYLKKHPGVRLCILSGSLATDSIRDFAHLMAFALDEGSPAPRDWKTQESWARALDPIEDPSPPGALLQLCGPGESPRAGFARRMAETQGFLASTEIPILVRLEVSDRPVTVSAAVEAALEKLREDWVLPGGEEIPDSLSFYRAARELSVGFYNKWVWPSEELWSWDYRVAWLNARAEWHREVRERLKGDARPGLDSPGLLEDAAKAGTHPSARFEEWDLIRREFKERTGKKMPDTVPVWVDDYLLRDALEFGRGAPAIIWTEYPEFGRALEKMSGWRYFGRGEEASAQIGKVDGKSTIIASLHAHHKGHNLQMFNRQLFTCCPSSATFWEQGMGRSHRPGQTSPCVKVFTYLQTKETRKALDEAIKDAEFSQDVLRSPQRLLSCKRIGAMAL